MGLSLEYVAKETTTNLWRNWMISLVAVVSVALSLSLAGDSLLFRQAVAHATVRWQGGVTLAIFMDKNVTQGQLQSIQNQLSRSPQVKTAAFCDQGCAYREYQKIFNNDQAMLHAISGPPDLPVSFRVTMKNASTADSFGSQYQNQPGVDQVEYAKDAIDQTVRLFIVLQKVALVVSAGILIFAIVLILNSIRLAIFSRRKEVGVMKLVGATNWFIRVPFMVEGLIQGAVGAGIAFLVMWLTKSKFSEIVAQNSTQALNSFSVSMNDLVTTGVLVAVIGVLIGAGGSAIALRRFLDV